MSDNGLVKAVTDDGFQKEVLDSSQPTLVDFWATWCAPCRAIAPAVEDLAKTYGDRVNFRKIDIDENPQTPMQYGIKGVPTLILFKDGEILDQVVGAAPKPMLENLVKKAL